MAVTREKMSAQPVCLAALAAQPYPVNSVTYPLLGDRNKESAAVRRAFALVHAPYGSPRVGHGGMPFLRLAVGEKQRVDGREAAQFFFLIQAKSFQRL